MFMTTIHAIYEGGVFRPTNPVDLPERAEVQLALISAEEQRDQAAGRPSALQRLARVVQQQPGGSDRPRDYAAQVDHYLYGTPKQP
jgi:predicted DNA-binding antitoxin AbrB/MazE fold protein